MSKWEYDELYKQFDMSGIIKIGTGIIKVHNIFEPLPDFMLTADCIFVDPPCSKANLNTFYTKADRTDYQDSYEPFINRLFECIDEIHPDNLFIEVFKSNKDRFMAECVSRYKYVDINQSTYYKNKRNICWIIHARNTVDTIDIEGRDEEDVIEYICYNYPYNVIGDLCMGRGLVGWYANKAGKNFVGTELNKKRLAVLIDGIKTGKHKYHK